MRSTSSSRYGAAQPPYCHFMVAAAPAMMLKKTEEEPSARVDMPERPWPMVQPRASTTRIPERAAHMGQQVFGIAEALGRKVLDTAPTEGATTTPSPAAIRR